MLWPTVTTSSALRGSGAFGVLESPPDDNNAGVETPLSKSLARSLNRFRRISSVNLFLESPLGRLGLASLSGGGVEAGIFDMAMNWHTQSTMAHTVTTPLFRSLLICCGNLQWEFAVGIFSFLYGGLARHAHFRNVTV